MQDATPITLGQEWSGYAGMLADNIERVEDGLKGSTASRWAVQLWAPGVNSAPGFGGAAAAEIAKLTGLPFVSAPNKFAVQGAHDDLVQFSGTLRTLAVSLYKIANDIRLCCNAAQWLRRAARSRAPTRFDQRETATAVAKEIGGARTVGEHRRRARHEHQAWLMIARGGRLRPDADHIAQRARNLRAWEQRRQRRHHDAIGAAARNIDATTALSSERSAHCHRRATRRTARRSGPPHERPRQKYRLNVSAIAPTTISPTEDEDRDRRTTTHAPRTIHGARDRMRRSSTRTVRMAIAG